MTQEATTTHYVYTEPVLELVRVCTECCRILEQCGETSTPEFCRTMRVVLPMVYLKMTLLGDVPEVDGWNEPRLTEEDYEYVRSSIAQAMASYDDFLDTFVEDFKYSEHPVLCTVSEALADVYQQIRELVEAFRSGYEESMLAALSDCASEFRLQWGQKLLNALRAIHDASLRSED